jgi:hypothetical protein
LFFILLGQPGASRGCVGRIGIESAAAQRMASQKASRGSGKSVQNAACLYRVDRIGRAIGHKTASPADIWRKRELVKAQQGNNGPFHAA